MRRDNRAADQLREVQLHRGYLAHAEGSALVEFGRTQVLCAASIERSVPPFLRNQGRGWVTAEYGMLPRATAQRTRREAALNHQSGRTFEIQRLIGRSLRRAVRLKLLQEITIIVDCDVIRADGGTRTAAITGGCVALADALQEAVRQGLAKGKPFLGPVAAVSVGMVADEPRLDLDYAEDSEAQTDMNVVMTATGEFVELQGSAEQKPFRREDLDRMLALADAGTTRLIELQRQALAAPLQRVP